MADRLGDEQELDRPPLHPAGELGLVVRQSNQLADIRLLRDDGLPALVTVVVAVAYSPPSTSDGVPGCSFSPSTSCSRSSASTAAPEFRFYAVADGINQLVFSSQRGLGPPTLKPGSQFLLLPFDS